MTQPALGPWNPGLQSDVPRAFLGLSTILCEEHVTTPLQEAVELRALTGLEFRELVVFRPERLILHALLVRVTADLCVPAGDRVEDLGINFRRMVDELRANGIDAETPFCKALHESLSTRIGQRLDDWLADLEERVEEPAPSSGLTGMWSRLFGSPKARGRPLAMTREDGVGSDWEHERSVCARWAAERATLEDESDRGLLGALIRSAEVVRSRVGSLLPHRSLVHRLAHGIALNELASIEIGSRVGSRLDALSGSLGFRVLPPQAKPVVLNTKGSSASGKSTLRLQQRELVRRLGLAWEDFALISPDIWRKYLLDYSSLGAAARYAGSLTGLELEFIDQRLDQYMAQKAQRGQMTHLLIDRFRFDSFAANSEEAGSNLLTRFGDQVFMFFMITPPDQTVVRAWFRGLEFGRFKPVDDLLHHNIEAYAGMPDLFFTWALNAEKSVQFEFLDNSVAKGQRPQTMAFGRNGHLVILNPAGFFQIDFFRKINLHARSPGEVYPGGVAAQPDHNAGFLKACVERVPTVDLADSGSGRVYARFERGKLTHVEAGLLQHAIASEPLRRGLEAACESLGPWFSSEATAKLGDQSPVIPQEVAQQTLGAWGFP
ncbi:MAG: hypothetical protein O2997_00055 [Proteobacteria bacterium]|nr:hypothetical protein [Pseudomonadota bacterium]